MNAGLRREITILVVSGLIIVVLGTLTGYTRELLIVGLLGYLAWYLYSINRLINWLSKPTRQFPETVGIWDEIYYQIYHIYHRQRKARKKLKNIVNRFQSSTQALPIAAIALNKNDEIEWFNHAAESIFNLRQNKDVGARINHLIRQPVFTSYLLQRNFKEMIELEYNHRRLSLCITPYGHNQFLMTAQDITQQRQLEDMRRDFVANASHELRTPITVISGYVETLCDNAESNIKAPLEHIQKQTVRMQQILDDLIILARLESSESPLLHDIVDLEELIQQIYHDAVVLDHDRHEITLSTEPASIMGNNVELQMAITNLVTNAIRYTPEEGSIRLFISVDNGGVHVGVEDNGIGIMPEHIGRLTERFYRVDPGRSREQGGTGLGLAIVKHVLDRHNARLYVHSEPGKGSLFRCDFELFEEDKKEKAA
jgi:two-component system phosphate regulon sensor histidine kinase PhoR